MHDQLSRELTALIVSSFCCVCSTPAWLFDESSQARDPTGTGPAAAEAQRRLLPWGSQVDLVEGSETGSSLSRSSPARSTAPSQGSEARSAVSSPRESQTLHISSSEEVDVMTVDPVETVDSPPQSLAYKELVEVVTCAVHQLASQDAGRSSKEQTVRTLPACKTTTFTPGPFVFSRSPHRSVS